MVKHKHFLIFYQDGPHTRVADWINKNNIDVISINEIYHYGDGKYEISVWYKEENDSDNSATLQPEGSPPA